MTQLSPQEKKIIFHALGLNIKFSPSRNHYYGFEDSENIDTLKSMVKRGLLKQNIREDDPCTLELSVTEKGKQLAFIEKYSSLNFDIATRIMDYLPTNSPTKVCKRANGKVQEFLLYTKVGSPSFDPSTNMNHVRDVILKMQDRGWFLALTGYSSLEFIAHFYEDGADGRTGEAYKSQSLEEAICKSALHAVNGNVVNCPE